MNKSADHYSLVRTKSFLNSHYKNVYAKYRQVIARAPEVGDIVEIGSGFGFAKLEIPELITSDVRNLAGIDKVIDARDMDLASNSIKALLLNNVFHHIPEPEIFFSECVRCLVPGGRIYMYEPYVGPISRPIYQWLHHENCDLSVPNWSFDSKDPLADANAGLPVIVFKRDLQKFKFLFSNLEVVTFRPCTAFTYWLSGGLSFNYSFVPGFTYRCFQSLDNCLTRFLPKISSFVDIELVKRM